MAHMLERFSARTVANFSKDLSKHERESNLFFDLRFLKVLEERFGFHNSNIIFYDENFEFQAITSKTLSANKSMFVFEHSYRYFFKKNPVFHTINRYFQNHAYSEPDKPLLFLSSDIIPKTEYDDSEYAHYLNREGFHYGVMLPFGKKGNCRLCIHKSHQDQDFSDAELNLLQLIYLMVSDSYASFNCLRKYRTASSIKSAEMDAQQIGSILLDDSMRIVDCNERASRYICSITGYKSIGDAKPVLMEQLHISGLVPGGTLEAVIDGYHFSVQSHSEGLISTDVYYSIIIRPREVYSRQSNSHSLSSLTFREIEIVEQLVKGRTYQQVSDELYVSLSTVRNHLQNIFKKLEINNQRQLILLYLQNQETLL